jgi:hypothetical protein
VLHGAQAVALVVPIGKGVALSQGFLPDAAFSLKNCAAQFDMDGRA